MYIKTLIFILTVLGTTSCLSVRTVSYAETAKEYEDKGEYDKAISFYTKHLNDRLEEETRPSSENPYFYYVLIGDNYLKQDNPQEAQNAYATALEHDVAKTILSDRFRQLASYHRNKGNFEQSFKILEQYRYLDELTFDIDLDTTHKAMLSNEDKGQQVQ